MMANSDATIDDSEATESTRRSNGCTRPDIAAFFENHTARAYGGRIDQGQRGGESACSRFGNGLRAVRRREERDYERQGRKSGFQGIGLQPLGRIRQPAIAFVIAEYRKSTRLNSRH